MKREVISHTGVEVRPTPSQLTEILEVIQQHARTCETAAQDSTEEALTGESCEREKNTRDAAEWMIRSKVWLEAEAVVRGFI